MRSDRKLAIGVFFVLAAVAGCDQLGQVGALPPIEVRFSPKGGCTELVVQQIEAARSTLLVQAYSFTSVPIAKALVDAHKRGVRVQVLLDRSQQTGEYTEADFLIHAGIPTAIDAKHPIAHNKIMIIDGRTVITGSFNFTKQAEEGNAENLLVIHDAAMATEYTANWQEHSGHSTPYDRNAAATHPKSDANQHRRGDSSKNAARDALPRF